MQVQDWPVCSPGVRALKYNPFFVLNQKRKNGSIFRFSFKSKNQKTEIWAPFSRFFNVHAIWKLSGKLLVFQLLLFCYLSFRFNPRARIRAHFYNVHNHWKSDGTQVSFIMLFWSYVLRSKLTKRNPLWTGSNINVSK